MSRSTGVLPNARSHHLMQRMQELLHQEAGRLGLMGLCGTCVTVHPFSQKVYEANLADMANGGPGNVPS